MQRYYGSTKVKAGFYWNPRAWDIAPIPGKGGILPGDMDTSYLRVPMVLMLFGAPVAGLFYVITLPIYLPLIILGIAFNFLGQKIYRLVPKPASRLVDKSRSDNGEVIFDSHLGMVYPDGGLPMEDEAEDER